MRNHSLFFFSVDFIKIFSSKMSTSRRSKCTCGSFFYLHVSLNAMAYPNWTISCHRKVRKETDFFLSAETPEREKK
jgi:hypothetical protein